MLFGRLDVLNPFLTYDRMGLLGSNPMSNWGQTVQYWTAVVSELVIHTNMDYNIINKSACVYIVPFTFSLKNITYDTKVI